MMKQKYGRIIFITSPMGRLGLPARPTMRPPRPARWENDGSPLAPGEKEPQREKEPTGPNRGSTQAFNWAPGIFRGPGPQGEKKQTPKGENIKKRGMGGPRPKGRGVPGNPPGGRGGPRGPGTLFPSARGPQGGGFLKRENGGGGFFKGAGVGKGGEKPAPGVF